MRLFLHNAKLLALFTAALGMLLTGCNEEAEPSAKAERTSDIAEELYRIPPAPAPVIREEPAPVTPIRFPPPHALLREQRARSLRGERQARARWSGRVSALPKPAAFQLEEDDYQQWEPLPQDQSTLPVNRSRILTADRRIGAILEDSVNSQVPGRVIAIVDRNVLSPNGRFVLLPAYTKIICQYESLAQTGDTRLPLTCTRAIRPDGTSVLLTGAIGGDQMGRTGLIGSVDNRVFERFGAAFILSGISALSQGKGEPSQSHGLRPAVNTVANHLGQVTSELIRQTIDLRPIISIAAGTRIQIIPQTDIILRKPPRLEEREANALEPSDNQQAQSLRHKPQLEPHVQKPR